MHFWQIMKKYLHIGRRGAILFLLGTSWLCMAYSVWLTPVPAGTESFWFAQWPPTIRVILWASTGIIAIVHAFKKNDALGWLALYIMPSQRAVSYAMAYGHFLFGHPAGVASALAGTVLWLAVVAIILVCAGWEEPRDPGELSHKDDNGNRKIGGME